MALRAALALLLAAAAPAVAAPPTLAQAIAPAPPDHPAPSPKPDAPAFKPEAAVPDTWIFSGLLDDGREPYSGTLLAGSDATEFEFRLGAGVSCAGGETAIGPGTVRLSNVPCSDDRTMRAVFVSRGDAELTVYGQIGERRFTTSAHRLDAADEPTRQAPTPGTTSPAAAPPVASPPAAAPATSSRPRNG